MRSDTGEYSAGGRPLSKRPGLDECVMLALSASLGNAIDRPALPVIGRVVDELITHSAEAGGQSAISMTLLRVAALFDWLLRRRATISIGITPRRLGDRLWGQLWFGHRAVVA
jgi:hypothetical protein